MANLYDDSDEMDDFIDYENYNNPGSNFGNPSTYMNQPPSVAFGGASSYGPSMGYGGGNFGTKHRDPLSGGGTIGFGQASRFGGIGDMGNPFGFQPGGSKYGVDTIGTDYVDLSNVKAPEMNKFQPNKFATSSKSSMKKPGKKKDEGRGVSFGDVTTFHVDKESNLTGSDKKSKSEDDNDNENEDDDDYEDEDEIENKALENKLKETAKEKKAAADAAAAAKPGTIASMLKKIANIEESITESGSIGLKKSLESEEYRISSSNDDLPKTK